MISGANSGIGLVTAMFLAKKGRHTMHQPRSGIGIYNNAATDVVVNIYIGAWGIMYIGCGILLSILYRCDCTFGVSKSGARGECKN